MLFTQGAYFTVVLFRDALLLWLKLVTWNAMFINLNKCLTATLDIISSRLFNPPNWEHLSQHGFQLSLLSLHNDLNVESNGEPEKSAVTPESKLFIPIPFLSCVF